MGIDDAEDRVVYTLGCIFANIIIFYFKGTIKISKHNIAFMDYQTKKFSDI